MKPAPPVIKTFIIYLYIILKNADDCQRIDFRNQLSAVKKQNSEVRCQLSVFYSHKGTEAQYQEVRHQKLETKNRSQVSAFSNQQLKKPWLKSSDQYFS